MQRFLIVNWEEGSIKALVVGSEEGIPQDILQDVNSSSIDILRVETLTRGLTTDISVRRLLVDEEEAEASGEEEEATEGAEPEVEEPAMLFSISDWELIA